MSEAFTANALAMFSKLRITGSIQARTPSGRMFEIRHRMFAGAHGYSVYVGGELQAGGHLLLTKNEVLNWLESLEEI